MSIKLTGNGFWESSRIILPEHRLRLQQERRELKRRERIELDEQEWEDVSRTVGESLQLRKVIKLNMYHEYEDLEIIGVVDRVDRHGGRFMVDGEWFKISDIEGAVLEGY